VDAISAGQRWVLTLIVKVNYFVAMKEGVWMAIGDVWDVMVHGLLAVHKLALTSQSSCG